jgi:hypothetical protein
MATAMYKGKEVETFDLTPTWTQILPALLLVLDAGNEEGKKIAREELKRMAIAADYFNNCQSQSNLHT